jgi:predicted homoserine dehydrogenase-like protein
MYRPYHLIGLELGISVASIMARGEPTGTTRGFRGDAVAVAKRDLVAGEVVDGEGGHKVYGKLMPARKSLIVRALPIGVSHGARLRRPIAAGEIVRWNDCDVDETVPVIRLRQEMEATFRLAFSLGVQSAASAA